LQLIVISIEVLVYDGAVGHAMTQSSLKRAPVAKLGATGGEVVVVVGAVVGVVVGGAVDGGTDWLSAILIVYSS
jgi:phage tail tape-measure protein